MKLLVCGSRGWTNYPAVEGILDQFFDQRDGLTIIHGAATGADSMAAFWARRHGVAQYAFPANWKEYGRKAGILRNLRMLDEEPDRVIAFWDGVSRGTKHMLDTARERGIPTECWRA